MEDIYWDADKADAMTAALKAEEDASEACDPMFDPDCAWDFVDEWADEDEDTEAGEEGDD